MLTTRIFRLFIWCLIFSPLSTLMAQVVGTSPYTHIGGGLFINEMSNGAVGTSQEYIELVVVGDPFNPTQPVDLTGWIIDDNNEDQASVGTATGHFSLGSCYSAVPPGSILVLYNAVETNPALPPSDPTDANGDGVYIIPHNSACLTACNSNPSSANNQYCPCASPGAPTGWLAGMANGGDMIQVRDLCGNVVHAISFTLPVSSYSPEVLASPFLLQTAFITQSGRVIYQDNNLSEDWNILANYVDAPIAGIETPGAPNNAANAAMIADIAAGTFSYGGYVNNCNTDAGLLVVPPDSPVPDPVIHICQGQDLSAFSTFYAGLPPSAQGYNFGYAYLLTTNSAPYNILQFNTTGNFNLSGLSAGDYIIWGFSYFQVNNTPNVTAFLTNTPGFSNITQIQNYTGCGYEGMITSTATNNATMLLNVMPAMTVSNLIETCGSTNGTPTYVVSFQINGGNTGSYTVTGGNGGILTGSNFTSNPINSGTSYTFTIDDGGVCGPITISGTPDCGCVTNAGSIDLTPINNCISEPAEIIHTVPPILDGNDVLVYILHTSPVILPPGTILAWSFSPSFSFNPGTMTPGVTYYIHAVAGDANAVTGVNLADLCLSVAGPIPVTWFNPPTASISGNLQVCLGQSTSFNVNFTGNGPFTFTYTANGTPFTVTTASNPYVLTVSPTVSTTYQLTGVSDANCSGIASGVASATVVVGPTASISNTPQIVCPGETTSIPVAFTGFPPFSLTYTANGNPVTVTTSANPYNITVSPVITTTYVLTDVNAGGCPGAVSGSVVVNVSAAPTATLSGGGVICPGGMSNLQVNFTGTGPFTFTYTANGINPQTVTTSNNPYSFSVSPASSTFYQITTVSDAACTNTSNTSQTVIVLPAVSATLTGSQTICPSGNATLTVSFTGSGPYTFDYTANGGSPVTVNTALNPYTFTVNPAVTTTYVLTSVSNGGCTGTVSGNALVTISNNNTPFQITQTLCFGASLTVGSTIFSAANPSGTVILPGAAANGCDSIINVNLSFYNEAIGLVTATLCPGGSIVVNGITYDASNTPNLTHIPGGSFMGCDSVIYVSLSFYPPAVRNLNQTLCFGQSLTVGATVFNQANPSGTVILPGAASNGCDSTVNVSLTFNSATINNLSPTLCTGSGITVNGIVFNQANPTGSTTISGGSVSGCDSTINVSLSFYPPAIRNLAQTLCLGQSITVGSTVFNQANPTGTVVLPGAASNGCDSTINVSLSFYPPAIRNLAQTLCFGQSITVGSTVFNQANPTGTVVLPGAASNGCDSTVNVSLTFNSATINNLSPTLCTGSGITVNGIVFNQANPTGSTTIIGGSVSGCDSTINVSLSFYPPAIRNLAQTLCFGQSITVGSTVFNQANPTGTVVLPGAASNGCDSTVNVSLTFNSATINNLSPTLCTGSGITVNGIVFNQANPTGSTTISGGSVSGCDSTIIVSLSFYPPAIRNISDTLCQNQTFTVGNMVFSASDPSGTVVVPGASVNGCDSTIFVSLTFINCNPGCNTFAGTMPVDTVVVCDPPGILTVSNNGDEILESDDTLMYILHEFPGNINPILAVSSNGTFDLSSLQSCYLYYITAIAGNALANGMVDLSDPCLSISNPQPVVTVEIGPPVIIQETIIENCPPIVVCGSSADITACIPDLSGIVIPPILACPYDNDTLFIPGYDIIDTIGGWTAQGVNVIISGDTVFVNGDTLVFGDIFNPMTSLQAYGGGDSVLNYTLEYHWPEYIVIENGLFDTITGPKCLPFIDIDINAISVLPVTFDIIAVNIPDGFVNCFQPCTFLAVQVSGGQQPYVFSPGSSITACGPGVYCAMVTDALGCEAQDCGVVDGDFIPPNAFIVGNLQVCTGSTTTLTTLGCASCFTVWSTGETAPFITVGSGTYCVTVTDFINGCTNFQCVTVTETGQLVINIQEDLCPGENIIVNGVIFNENNPIGTVTAPGTGADCDTLFNVTCNIIPPAVNAINQILCAGQSLLVNGTLYDQNNPVGTEFMPGMSYAGCDSLIFVDLSFYPPAIFNLQQSLCPGQVIQVGNQIFNEANPTGTVILPNASVNNCDSTVIVNLTFGSAAIGNLTATLCPGESIAIGNEQFNQSNPSGSVIFPGGSSGGCDSVLNVSISFHPLVVAGLSGDAGICAGDSTLLTLHLSGSNTADIVYNSFVSGSQVLSNVSDGYTFWVTPGQSDTYTIVAINIPGYTCIPVIDQSAVVQVSNLSLSTSILSDYNGFSVSCQGNSDGSAQVNVTGGLFPYSYQWSNGSITPVVAGLEAGVASVTVTDGAGCNSTDTILLTEPPVLIPDISVVPPLCYGDLNGSILAGGVNGLISIESYSLDGSLYFSVDSLPFEIPWLGAGVYDVWFSDDNGCITVAEANIPAPTQNTVELGDDIFLSLGDSVLIAAQINFDAATVVWSPLTYLHTTGDLLQVVSTPLETINYTIVATDINGCEASDALTIFVDTEPRVFVPNIFSPNGDGFNDIALVFAKDAQVKEVQTFAIFDRWGNETYRADHFPPNAIQFGWDGNFRGRPMDPAVFVWFAVVEFTDGSIRQFKGDLTLVR